MNAERLARLGAPGCVLGLLRDGEASVSVHGVANLNTGAAVTPDTLFNLASVTKPFTATLVMQLAEQGALGLDTPVRAYLPEFTLRDEAAAARITPRHLLTHSAGFEGEHVAPQVRGDDALARFLEACPAMEQIHEPGAYCSYSNAGYAVLGRLVERIAGTTFDTALRERIFDPLGMSRTTTLPEEAILHAVAAGHEPGPDGAFEVVPWHLLRSRAPAGGIVSTAADVLAFARAHLDRPSILAPPSVELMRTAQIEAPGGRWGLGWALGDRTAGHDGGFPGSCAILRLVPDRCVALVLLANTTRAMPAMRALAAEVLAEVAGVRPAVAEPPPDDEDPAAFEGVYERASLRVELRVRDGRLHAAFDAHDVPGAWAGPLEHVGPARYLLKLPGRDLPLAFVDGAVYVAGRLCPRAAT